MSCGSESGSGTEKISSTSPTPKRDFGTRTYTAIEALNLKNTHDGFETLKLNQLKGADKSTTLKILKEAQINLHKDREQFLSYSPKPTFKFENWNQFAEIPFNNGQALKRNTINILHEKDGIMLGRSLTSNSKIAILRWHRYLFGQENWVLNASFGWSKLTKPQNANRKLGYLTPDNTVKYLKKYVDKGNLKNLSTLQDSTGINAIFLSKTSRDFTTPDCKVVKDAINNGIDIIANYYKVSDIPSCVKNAIKNNFDIELTEDPRGTHPKRIYTFENEKIYWINDWNWPGWRGDITQPEIKNIDVSLLKDYFSAYNRLTQSKFKTKVVSSSSEVIQMIMHYAEVLGTIDSNYKWANIKEPNYKITDTSIILNDTNPYYLYQYSLDGGVSFHKFNSQSQSIPYGNYKPGSIIVSVLSSIKILSNLSDKVKEPKKSKVITSSKVSSIDLKNPIYTSADGNYIQISGRPDGYGLDWVFIAEGYQAHERDKFFDDVIKMVPFNRGEAHFNGGNPDPLFQHLHEFYNIHAIFAVSNEHINGETKAPKDTAFKAHYNGRLLMGNFGAVENYIRPYLTVTPEMKTVLVNTMSYGGAATYMNSRQAWSSIQNQRIMLHETAHAYAGLYDEYNETLDVCNKNICTEAKKADVYWQHYLDDYKAGETICTSLKRNDPHCNSGTRPGWYASLYGWTNDKYDLNKKRPDSSVIDRKPAQNTLMHYGENFEVVGAEIWALELYKSTKPFLVYDSAGKIITADSITINPSDTAVTLSASRLSKDVKLEWYMNDRLVTAHKGDSIQVKLNLGDVIKLVGYDNSGLIHRKKLYLTKREFKWQVTNSSTYSTDPTLYEEEQWIKATITKNTTSLNLTEFEYLKGHYTPVEPFTFGGKKEHLLTVTNIDTGETYEYLPDQVIRAAHSQYHYNLSEAPITYGITLKHGEKYVVSLGELTTFVTP